MQKYFYQFLQGRYGTDQFSIFLLLSYFFLRGLSVVLNLVILIFISIFTLVWAYYRIFSRNIIARQQENQKYLRYTAPYWDKFNFFILSHKDKEHRYFRCPNCQQRLRTPRDKGKIHITCSTCHHTFTRNS